MLLYIKMLLNHMIVANTMFPQLKLNTDYVP
jgi:hypothetical protein